MSLKVLQVYGGCHADSLSLPLVQVLNSCHGVEHLVANHLGPKGHRFPPHLWIKKGGGATYDGDKQNYKGQ